MRGLRTGWIVVTAGLAASGPARAMTLESDVRRIPARMVAHRLFVVPVTVNGTGPYPFLLDTGATSSMVADDLACELALPPAGLGLQQTPTAAGAAPLVQATLTLGRVRREGDVIRAPLTEVRALDPAIRGLLGQDVLRLGNWWLDYRGAALLEDPAGRLGRTDLGERLSVHWHGERPAIEARPPDRPPWRLVLDSAASSPVMFGVDPSAHEPAGTALLTSLEDRVTVPVASIGPLRAGRADIPRFAAAILAGSAVRTEDGLLPTSLFEGVYFDNRAGTVVLNPRRRALAAIP